MACINFLYFIVFRNKIKFSAFLNKKCNTNPRRGPYHQRSPAKIFQRAVRGMLPHKTARGMEALKRLRVFNGIPAPYDTKKRVVIPKALRALRLAPHRKFTVLGELAAHFGWTKKSVLEACERRRKVKSAAFYHKKQHVAFVRAGIKKSVFENKKLGEWKSILEQYGY